MSVGEELANPILNSPYEPPARHFDVGLSGPTAIVEGRRPSASYVAVPVGRRTSRGEQTSLDLDTTGERREEHDLVNELRRHVSRWRAYGFPHVTPVSRKLLQHWGNRDREDRVLFCQREAAETAIWLAEVSGRRPDAPDFRPRLAEHNRQHNDGLARVALKMATGTGKTIVMGMLIAWQCANKASSPRDARFANRFLVVAPGITIRDRLRVLLPEDDRNVYVERDLVPADLWPTLQDASIAIVNYHAFLPRDAKEIRGVGKVTRQILTAGKKADPFRETDADIVARVLRDVGGRGKGGIVVLNDEAHHCYVDKPVEADPLALKGEDKKEAEARNEGARVWFRGIRAVARGHDVKAVYDLSATPFYLGGSGYQEGYIFPWVVSDFSLNDAIESGIVKVPRLPVEDDVQRRELPTYRTLWEHVGAELPKKAGRKAASDAGWVPPSVLEGALRSLYRSYERRFERWQRELEPLGEPPPVMIIVCSNTVVSKLVYDWIAGQPVEQPDGTEMVRTGNLPLLSNVADGSWLDRARTILVDSAQLESGDALSKDFREAAAHEIELFKKEHRRRNPGADVDDLTDADLLREVLNTVGKRDRLGEPVRCVVSVSMLTEGWDANTVTHILGLRRFGSQLLCEQVVGRGLRRRAYVPDKPPSDPDARFAPEYAEVYGVPFDFIPTDRPIPPAPPSRPAVEVRAVPERGHLRITFPKVEGYRVELPDEAVHFDAADAKPLHVDREQLAMWTETAGLAGVSEEQELDEVRDARWQQVAYEVAAAVLRRHLPGHDGVLKPWLFPALVDVTKRWLDPATGLVSFEPGTPVGALLLAQHRAGAAQAVYDAVVRHPQTRSERLFPILRRFDPEGSTDEVDFLTRKVVVDIEKSPVNRVVLDGPKGNTWEEYVAGLLELDRRVHSFVKNDRLDFTIPYVWKGRTHQYVPDFLVRLVHDADDDVDERTLIVEVSGGRKSAHSPGPTSVKATTARDHWCTAVNNHQGFGRWGYVEITDMATAEAVLSDALDLLRADGPLIGDPDRSLAPPVRL